MHLVTCGDVSEGRPGNHGVADMAGPIAGPSLEGRQAVLFDTLAARSASLGRMYLGVLAALERGDPESLVQSSHSMRELLEKLPSVFEQVPQERSGPSLKEAANTLLANLERAQRNSRCWSEERWEGEIDGPLRKFLEKALRAFSDVVAAMKPPRRTERTELLRRVDASPLPMPQVVEHLRVQEWEMHAGFFQGVAHHTLEVELEEFRSMVWQCEQFLLDRLVPRTFDDRRQIAAIVAEVESGD